MKLRLLDDSIRLRLSRDEVIAAHEHGIVEGQTRFPDGSVFTFALEALKNSSNASASYASDRLVVKLPALTISAWARDDTAVSLHDELTLPLGGQLKLLVEKDFRCVSPRGDEDQSNLFQNPERAC
jgi:Family of unknown function (DUF7009)